MKTINQNQMLELIRSHKGALQCTVVMDTEFKLNKTGNPFRDKVVRKIALKNVCIGYNYENAVNKQRSREDLEADFIAKPRTWGERVDLKTVTHKGAMYVTMKTNKLYGERFECEGNPVNKAQIEAFIPPERKNKTQGVEKEVYPQDLKACNLKQIVMYGTTYQIV